MWVERTEVTQRVAILPISPNRGRGVGMYIDTIFWDICGVARAPAEDGALNAQCHVNRRWLFAHKLSLC